MNRLLLHFVVFFSLICSGRAASAGEFCPDKAIDDVYELLPGSMLRIDCLDCELGQSTFNLAGRFRLSQTTRPGNVFGLLELDLRDEEGRGLARIMGTGILEVSNGSQSLSLEVALFGGKVSSLSGSGMPAAAFPEIDAEAKLDPKAPREGIFIESIRLVARPVPKAIGAAYRLKDGSYFLNSCDLCGRLDVPVPIGGTFKLVPSVNAGPFTSYRVECLSFFSFDLDPIGFQLVGYGSYQRVEEFAMHHEMELDLETREGPTGITGIVFQSGSVERAKPFPVIEIDLTQSNPSSRNSIFKLHLIALPEDAVLFRRGDINEDGLVDISDPTGVLSWLFLGSEPPGCLDAADANGDGAHDLSDPVTLLEYLFLAGEPPPAPGPEACGTDPLPRFGCGRYAGCLAERG